MFFLIKSMGKKRVLFIKKNFKEKAVSNNEKISLLNITVLYLKTARKNCFFKFIKQILLDSK